MLTIPPTTKLWFACAVDLRLGFDGLANLVRNQLHADLTSGLATFDRATPTGCRDYAMALCLIDLDLRVGEVADLTLSDVDVAAGTLRLATA